MSGWRISSTTCHQPPSRTPGKRSPDGRFLEYKFNREIARRIVLDLQDRGYDAELLVPEETDIPLKERANRVNSHRAALGKENVILVSIHVNAAGNGSKWLNATGWSVYTSKGHTKSDNLATCLAEAAIKNLSGRKIRSEWSDGDIDFEESFYLLSRTLCTACLTENGFMDSRESLAYISTQAILDASAKYPDCVAELFKRLEYCTEKVAARTVGGLFPKENSPFSDANVCKTRKRKTLLATFNYACSE